MEYNTLFNSDWYLHDDLNKITVEKISHRKSLIEKTSDSIS